MEEKLFEVSGRFLEKKREKKFSKRVFAVTEKFAREKVLAIFGSKQKIKRRHIWINETKEVKEDEGKEE